MTEDERSAAWAKYDALCAQVAELVLEEDRTKAAEQAAYDRVCDAEAVVTLKYSQLPDDTRKAHVVLDTREGRDAYRAAVEAHTAAFRAFDLVRAERDRLLTVLMYRR